MAARNHIDLVVKTVRTLEILAQATRPLSLKEIASQLGLVKSSAFRILYTLKEIGFVEQAEPGGAYRLTFLSVGLARRQAGHHSLIQIARPYLARLRMELDESVWLAELRRGRVVLVDTADSRHPLRLTYDLGDPCPLHATALGKSIAAFLSPAELQRCLGKGPLERFTANTITSRVALKEELEKVRQSGWAANREETVEGAIILGAPVFDAAEKVFAAISVSVPTARCLPEKRKAIIAAVKSASQALSAELKRTGFHTSAWQD